MGRIEAFSSCLQPSLANTPGTQHLYRYHSLTHSDPSVPRTRPDSQGVSKGIWICATPHQFWDAHIPIESGVRGRFSIFQSHGNQAPGKKPRLQYEVPPGSFKDRRRQFRILLTVQYGNTHGRSGPGNITPAAGRVAGGHP